MTKIHNIYLADKETMCFIRISKHFRVSTITKQVNGTMRVTGKQQLTKKGLKVTIDLSVNDMIHAFLVLKMIIFIIILTAAQKNYASDD